VADGRHFGDLPILLGGKTRIPHLILRRIY